MVGKEKAQKKNQGKISELSWKTLLQGEVGIVLNKESNIREFWMHWEMHALENKSKKRKKEKKNTG